MKRFGDKDKKASEECYVEVAEKFATTSGKFTIITPSLFVEVNYSKLYLYNYITFLNLTLELNKINYLNKN